MSAKSKSPGEDRELLRFRELGDCLIAGAAEADSAYVQRNVAVRGDQLFQRIGKVRVDQKPHYIVGSG